MGSAVRAECSCGLNEEILVGGGMMDFTTTCWFPCACAACGHVVEVNLLDAELRCPDCGAVDPVPYDDPALIAEPGNYEVADWNMASQLGRVLVLTNGAYRCPGCGKDGLRFVDAGLCWD